MKLGIIILNWNDAAVTLQCLRSLALWQNITPEIIVVDNASSDDSAAVISSEFADIQLVRSDINRGFAGGNNRGIERARERGCDTVLLLNSDAEIEEAGVAKLIAQLEAGEDPIIIGPAIEERSAAGSLLTCGGRDIGRYSRTRIVCDKKQNAVPGVTAQKSNTQSERGDLGRGRSTLQEVGYVPGTVVLIPVAVFDSVGLLDEDYFFSGEIADFCAAAREQNIKSMIDLSVVAKHGDPDEDKPLRGSLYIYYTLRNRFLYVSKHGGRRRLWLKLVWTIKACCMLGLSIIKADFKRARAIAIGLADGIHKKWGNRNKRFCA
jgi:GT2 family glycosyltransferase